MKQITTHLYQVPIGPVNAFILNADELILIDTGYKGKHETILKALNELGKTPADIRHILLTHSHPDHAGALADIMKLTEAQTYMHGADAALMRQGLAGRLPFIISPGLMNKIIFNVFMKGSKNENDVVAIGHELIDGEQLSMAGGIKVVYTPGHSLGHVCFLLETEQTLVAGDICSNMMGLGWSTVYEDRAVGLASIKKAAAFNFDKAVFGHGKPIMESASEKIKAKFK